MDKGCYLHFFHVAVFTQPHMGGPAGHTDSVLYQPPDGRIFGYAPKFRSH
jgi:hypothetical protein